MIENCVRSIQLTRYDRYEVILVDDGSTDNTAQLMAELAAGDLRIKVLTQINAGKGAALNLGIRNATGEVLMFVDADGIFSRYTVEEMLQGFEDGRTGAVCGDDRPVNLNRVQTRMLAFISHIGTGMVRRALTMIGCLPIVSGNIGAFPRKVVEEIGLFREDTVGEDLELTWRVHKAGYRVVFAPRALVYAESPSTIAALWRQRVRRARGLLQTMAVHKGVIGNLRHGRFGAYLLFNAITMVVRPLVQIVVLLDLAFLLALGYNPLGGDAWAVLGWLGVIVTLVLPLIPLYSVFTSLTMVAALGQELRQHLRRRLASGLDGVRLWRRDRRRRHVVQHARRRRLAGAPEGVVPGGTQGRDRPFLPRTGCRRLAAIASGSGASHHHTGTGELNDSAKHHTCRAPSRDNTGARRLRRHVGAVNRGHLVRGSGSGGFADRIAGRKPVIRAAIRAGTRPGARPSARPEGLHGAGAGPYHRRAQGRQRPGVDCHSCRPAGPGHRHRPADDGLGRDHAG